MKLLDPALKKLHTEVPLVPQWVVSLETGPFVKLNNAEFTNVHSFTSLLMFRTSFALLAGYFLPSPLATILSSLCLLKSPDSLHGGGGCQCLGLLDTGCLLDHCSASELGSVVFWAFDIHDLSTRCRKLLFVFSVPHTKSAFSSAQFSRYNTNFFDHSTIFLKTE
jgi:hypothetical protein